LTQLYNINNSLRLEKIDELLSDDDTLKLNIEKTNKNLLQTKEMIIDAKKMLGDISDLSLVKTLKESAGSFDILRESHSKYGKRWFIAFCISVCLIVG
jgi:hypothetical protein